MPLGCVYVIPAHSLWGWVRIIAYTCFAGRFYHCSFNYDGLWSASKSGMSMVWLPLFFYSNPTNLAIMESVAEKRATP